MSQYKWNSENAALIKDHSLIKHQMYREYIRNYVLERAVLKQMDRISINIVDGFCGGGTYVTKDGAQTSGSPLVVLEALRDAEQLLNIGRIKPIQIDFRLYCFDNDAEALESLRRSISNSEYQKYLDTNIVIKKANFSQEIPKIIERLQHERGRAIFILDQYGYNAVSFDSMSRIFRELPSPEVILTFSYGFLNSFLSEYGKLSKAFEGIGLEAPPRDEFDRAQWEPNGRPFFIQRQLIKGFRAAAPFFTPFFIKSRDSGPLRGSNLSYWLVHLAAHERANDVMKQTHWDLQNHSAHFGGPGLEMLGYDPHRVEQSKQPFMFGDDERALSHKALLDDIPRTMRPANDWMRVGDLWKATCNETPSTSEMQREALAALSNYSEVEILGAGGGAKRGGKVDRTDLIRMPPQTSFFFMKRPAA
ncbi:three-Cys-motif partner protein TcmP [Phenylobacterium sp.]|uniref:three-Cys-motif partner protein TcmP n=1 Tax=Phenylobacterium sp. TaxID=1871053 RepID=UPI002728EA16|nr:three-Cys-motif partner protein TcmP [Phenylobacterium sp.]MDO8802507.1 three-Cys-motif partner protein TcmP [Phenylobacterium sp.]